MIKQVYKFGGASVKNADAVRNLASIVKKFSNGDLLIVVSAMGKTTNMLEGILSLCRSNSSYSDELSSLKKFHSDIICDLFESDSQYTVFTFVNTLFDSLESGLKRTDLCYDAQYDMVVSYGELISSTIVSHFLQYCALNSRWIDARQYIVTDLCHRLADVDWASTYTRISSLAAEHRDGCVFVTQGFIGASKDNITTTLGREGSDYSAAIFASCLGVSSLTIWKDVNGLFNADPKRFEHTSQIFHISFRETIELSFYGASIIHPKTLKPLQNKDIKLIVRSFLDLSAPPTVIDGNKDEERATSYIVKDAQTMVSFMPRDYSFMNEHNLQTLFASFDRLNIHANMVQTSALMLSICFDRDESRLQGMLRELRSDFSIRYNDGLQLFTIRNYRPNDIRESDFLNGKRILLKQGSRRTMQYVLALSQ